MYSEWTPQTMPKPKKKRPVRIARPVTLFFALVSILILAYFFVPRVAHTNAQEEAILPPIEGLNPDLSQSAIEALNALPSSNSWIKGYLHEHFDEDMIRTFKCESGLRQWDGNGNVLISHTNDKGVTQINLKTWQKEADKLGYNLDTVYGNVEMAKHILEVQGKSSWVCYNKQQSR